MNVIAELEFELTYYDIIVQHFSHITIRVMGLKGVFGSGGLLLLGNSDVGNWLLSSYLHSLVIFFLFVEIAKDLRTEGKKRQRHLLNSIFIFGFCFLELAEITGLSSQDIKGISWIILANFKFQCLPYVSVFNWYVQLRLLWVRDTMYCRGQRL